MKDRPVSDKSTKKQAFASSLKIIIPLYATYILFVVSIFAVFLPLLKNHMMGQKKEMIHSLTESTRSLLSEYDQRVNQGELSLEDAQQRAVRRIRNLRYGMEGKDYFWILDMQNKVIMHPYVSGLEGKDQTDFVDSRGKHVFAEFVRTVEKEGSGYVEYMWQWKDDQNRIVPKISYVKGFSPWGWVIGTGLYLEDISREVGLMTREFIKIFLGVLFIIILMSFYITWQTIAIEEKKSFAEKEKSLEELRLKKLLELSRMSDASLSELTEFALEEAVNLTESDIGYIAFLKEDETLLTLHTWSKHAGKPLDMDGENPVFRVEETGLWAEAVRKRDTVIINDYEKFKSPDKKGYPQGHDRISRVMSLPVFDGGKIVVLAGVGNKARDYNESDVRQLKLMMDGMWAIIQRKNAEETLLNAEKRYRSLFMMAPLPLMEISKKGNILQLNQEFIEVLGYKNHEIRTVSDLWELAVPDAEDRKNLSFFWNSAVQEGQGDEGRGIEEHTFKCRDGSLRIFIIRIRGILDHVLVSFFETTEYKKMEAGLRQAQKMEALGTLAGGIAHDFNNILSSVLGFAELAKLSSAGDDATKKNLDQILAAGIRARDLVRHILTFSRRGEVQKGIVRIQPLIKECLKFLKASVPADIEIRHEIGGVKGLILADPTQIHQVLMNLFTNAAQAMKEKGGILEVRLKSVFIREDEIDPAKELKPGRYLQLTVADTGCGIPKELTARIFEPFFTTKGRGEGTGMGLSTVYGIIRDMEGAVSVYSEPGRGTAFHVMLPEYWGGPSTREAQADFLSLTGQGRILVVDDEEAIVDWTRQVLSKLGYDVVAVTDSREALERIKQIPHEIDLVLTDMAMPRMNGLDLSRQIKAIRPDLPIILCTGFSGGLTEDMIKNSGILEILMKPVIVGELAQAVGNVLGRKI